MNEYLEWMKSDEYKELAEAEEKFFAEHWVHDMLDAPDALISVIETKISRAVLGERHRILTQWQYEMTQCKCEDAMGHMERRIKAELPLVNEGKDESK